MLSTYSPSITSAFWPAVPTGSISAISITYTGRRAEQLVMGAISVVIRRSRALSIVLVAMMPGMAQAYELSSGTNALPLRPTPAISRSIMNDTRAR